MNKTGVISSLMETAVLQGVFPGGVLLCALNKDILFHQGFGVADFYTKEPMLSNAIFDLASLTKPIVIASLICMMIKDGNVELETTLGEIIPEASKTSKGNISVEMLLRHTSGLPSYRPFYRCMLLSSKIKSIKGNSGKRDRFVQLRQMMRHFILSEKLEYPSGTKQLYSDLGYILLAWIIEIILKQRLDIAVKEKIFDPLGIKGLFFVELDPVEPSKILNQYSSCLFVSNHMCSWRKRIIRGEVDDENAWAVGGIEGHAGLFGDAISLQQFCCEILNVMNRSDETVLDSFVFENLSRKIDGQDMVAGFDTPSVFNSSAGQYFSDQSLGHLGFTGTSFWIDPRSGLISILLTNRTHPSRLNQEIRKFRPLIHDSIALTFL